MPNFSRIIGWLLVMHGWSKDYSLATLILANISYALALCEIVKIGIHAHSVRASGGNYQEVYPPGFYVMLGLQMVTMFMYGLATGDWFVLVTRGCTLLVIPFTWAMARNTTGIFVWDVIKWYLRAAVIALFLASMVWDQWTDLRAFVKANYLVLSYTIYTTMVLYMIFGQGFALKTFARRLWRGEYRQRGFSLQVARLSGFLFQTLRYGHVSEQGFRDPVAIQGILGGTGALVLVIVLGIGKVWHWLKGPPPTKTAAAH